MIEAKEKVVIIVTVIFILIGILIGITFEAPSVSGLNQTNDTVITRVNITNSPPDLTQVLVTSPIDLTAGDITEVNCTGYVFDYNGYDDITFTNATFYDIAVSFHNDVDDRNHHYTNSTCSCVQNGPVTNATCTCTFNVWYYANSGSWICNLTVGDGQFTDTMNSSIVTMNTVIGVGVTSEIDYGDLSVTDTSNYIPANISNWGNVPINVSVRGFGGEDESIVGVGNLSMMCEYGNISSYYMRYALNTSVTFANMTNITNTSTPLNIDLPVRINDTRYGNDTNRTYWRLYIPSTVGGLCNGTLEFTAMETII